MRIELTPEQQAYITECQSFVDREIVPYADTFDQQEYTSPEMIRTLIEQGYLGSLIPQNKKRVLDLVTYGFLHQEIGRGCSSLRSLITVHDMVAHAILKWGNAQQKEYWLPQLASGEKIAAFGLTEPQAGSDARGIQTTATLSGDMYKVTGKKYWTTYGQIADVFLVFAVTEEQPVALLIEKNTPGFTVQPMQGSMGVRASMLAQLHFDACMVPKTHVVGRPGFGLNAVASTALDLGRYSVAWGCVGIAQACLEASFQYSSEREQFGTQLINHQLIQQMITNMATNVRAARLLCIQAGYLKDQADPQAPFETLVAKYFASTTAYQAASDTVQIHGANGCGKEYSAQRYLRDSKIMEIIEGSTQLQQVTIAQHMNQGFGSLRGI